jgi:ribosomal protein L2
VTLNKNSLPSIKKIFPQKAGFFSLLGKKPHVRGVARNAVDHPHGGRTKSIKCPRTP